MRKLYILFFILFSSIAQLSSKGDNLPSWASNISGAQLLNMVRRNIDNPSPQITDKQIEATLFNIDCHDTQVLNRFSEETFDYDPDGIAGLTALYILQLGWMEYLDNNSKLLLTLDLHNIFPCPTEIATKISYKSYFGPGIPERPYYETINYGNVKIGTKLQDNQDIGVWEFPDEYKGDFARAFFYVVSKYGPTFYTGWGINFLDDWTDLLIRYEVSPLLLKWHREDPVSDIERERNKAIKLLQNNSNIFIEYPSLIDKIWDPEYEDSDEDDVVTPPGTGGSTGGNENNNPEDGNNNDSENGEDNSPLDPGETEPNNPGSDNNDEPSTDNPEDDSKGDNPNEDDTDEENSGENTPSDDVTDENDSTDNPDDDDSNPTNPDENEEEEDDDGGNDDPIIDDDNTPEEERMLKATYSKISDTWIYLSSFYIPSDAKWTINNEPVAAPKVKVADYEEGPLVLEYMNNTEKGKITIVIEK